MFANHDTNSPATGQASNPVLNLLAEMELADQVSSDIFGVVGRFTRWKAQKPPTQRGSAAFGH